MPILFDFEKGDVLEKILQVGNEAGSHNYFFLLGNTLGNFDNTDKILSNLKLSMFSENHLIIGNQISNLLASQKLVDYYKTQEVFDLTASVLLNYGMDCSIEELGVRWNSAERQIEVYLTLSRNRDILIAGRSVHFERGEEILLAISKKFVEDSIVEVFRRVGFRIDLFTTNKQKDTCIISVTPSRYKS